ncbi:hypothetical protein F4604DRAFT_1982247 [Suillus subluteus]|nr:hypothetical protein F4604DRAFT_1982247 [Suillus subluteus]
MDYEIKDKLQQLSLFLSNHPQTIPYADAAQTHYHFFLYDEKIKDMGPIRALNCELECVMGQHHNVDVLESHLIKHHNSPETILLIKWVDDLTTAAKAAFASAGIMLPTCAVAAKPAAKVTAKSNGKKTIQGLVDEPLSNSVDTRYIDLPETDDLRASGAKTHPLLLEGMRHCYKVPEGEVWREGVTKVPHDDEIQVQCIASKHCGTTWKMPRARDQIITHLSKCTHLDEDMLESAGIVTCAMKPPQDMVTRAALALQNILQWEYGDTYDAGKYHDPSIKMEQQNPALIGFSPAEALAAFQTQYRAYIKGEDPFNQKMRSNESTLDWWKALQGDELANILAEVSTLQNHIKIRQWHHFDPKKQKMPYKPLVKWHDMETMILGKHTAPSNLDSEDGFDDSADWLDGNHSLPAEFERNFAKQASQSVSAPIKKTAVKSSSGSLPAPSDWNLWE